MDLDKLCADALKRLQQQNKVATRKAREKVARLFYPEPFQRVTLTIHTRDQFYACVKWCNKNCRPGSEYWTVVGRVLRYIDPSKHTYKPPRTTDWILKVPVDAAELIAISQSSRQDPPFPA